MVFLAEKSKIFQHIFSHFCLCFLNNTWHRFFYFITVSKESSVLGTLLKEAIAQDGGLAVFRYYGFEPSNRPQKVNPFREERTSSFFISQRYNKLIFKDFGDDSLKGDCRKFVELYEKIDYAQAFKRLCEIYHLSDFGLAVPRKVIQKQVSKKIISTFEKKLLDIQFKAFSEEELDFWYQKGFITQEILEANQVFSLKSFKIEISEGKIKSYENLNFVFAYQIVAQKSYKLYMPKSAYRVYAQSKTVFLPNLNEARNQFGEDYNYAFGLETLDLDKKIVLCGGEPDCLALKSAGYNAFTLGSEQSSVPDFILKKLQKSNICQVLYDTDFTGLKASQTLAKKLNAQRLILPKLKKQFEKNHFKPIQNDVCDYLNLYGWDTDLQLLLSQAIYENQDYQIPHTCTFEVQKYLSEKIEIFPSFIQRHKRIQIDADAGIGKTYTLLVEIPQKIQKRILFVVPFAIQVEQIEQEYQEKVQDLVCFTNASFQDLEQEEMEMLNRQIGQVNVCTYDKIKAVYKRLTQDSEEEILVIVDESHLLTSEYGYRAKAIHDVLEVCNQAYKVVYLSATPDYSLCRFSGFQLIRFKRTKNPHIFINLLNYSGEIKKVILKFILERIYTITSERITIIRLNNKTLAKVIANLLIQKGYLKNDEIDFVFSEKRKGISTKTKESIVNSSKIPEKVKLLFVTACFDCGINIENKNIGELVSFETKYSDNCKDTFKQFIARFRHLENVNVTICKPQYYQNMPEAKPKEKLYQHLSKDAQNKLALLPFNDIHYCQKLASQTADIHRFGLNSPQTPRYLKANADISAIHKLLYKDAKTQSYKINYNYIRFALKEYERKNLSSSQFLKDILSDLPNSILSETNTFLVDKNEKNNVTLNHLWQQEKDNRKARTAIICQTMQANPEQFFDAVHAEYRDVNLKKEIKRTFNVSPSKEAVKLENLFNSTMNQVAEQSTIQPSNHSTIQQTAIQNFDEEITQFSHRYFYLLDFRLPKNKIPQLLEKYAGDVNFGFLSKTLTNQILLFAKEKTGKDAPHLFSDNRKLEDAHWLALLKDAVRDFEPTVFEQKKCTQLKNQLDCLKYDEKILEYEKRNILTKGLDLLFKIQQGEKLKSIYKSQKRKLKTIQNQINRLKEKIKICEKNYAKSQIKAFEINDLSLQINQLRPHKADWQGLRANMRLLNSLFETKTFKKSIKINEEKSVEKYFVEIGDALDFEAILANFGFTASETKQYLEDLAYQIDLDLAHHQNILSKNAQKSTESPIHDIVSYAGLSDFNADKHIFQKGYPSNWD